MVVRNSTMTEDWLDSRWFGQKSDLNWHLWCFIHVGDFDCDLDIDNEKVAFAVALGEARVLG
ncbi:hypothetical protein WN944_006773 [Citrus x changshan-huyou]|uniref:Uncharacterized protein n=1 Tax=Citrus x changshan-huyou TaxID=2935761 RepID=A0AAP0MJR4_9ROSI